MTRKLFRPRHSGTTGRKLVAGWTTIAGLIAALLSGCSGVPDRSADADAVTAALRALPGVTAVDAKYTNGGTTGQSYNVTVTLAPDTDRAQTIAVAQGFDQQIASVVFDRHTLRFSLIRGADRMNSFRDRPNRDDVTPVVTRWFDLAEQLDEPVERSTSEDLDLIKITTDDVAALIDRIARDAADLGSAHWLITSGRSRIDLKAGHPDRATAALIARLVADGGQWTISYEPSAVPALELAVWLGQSQELEPTARAHLRQIAALEPAVTYVLRPSGQTALTVVVHGCLAGGSLVQQELNREFGTC